MKKLLTAFLACESGATAIEYAVIACGLSIAVLAAANGIGGTLKTGYFGAVSTSLR